MNLTGMKDSSCVRVQRLQKLLLGLPVYNVFSDNTGEGENCVHKTVGWCKSLIERLIVIYILAEKFKIFANGRRISIFQCVQVNSTNEMAYSRRSRYSHSPSPYKLSPRAMSRSLSRSRSISRSRSRSRESSVENPGNNLYVTGLSTRITKRDLAKHFSSEGKVEDVHLVTDPWTKESRGFGFVTMSTVDEAARCVKYLNRSVLEGRVITVEKARRCRGRTPTPGRYLGLRRIRTRHRSSSYSPYHRRYSVSSERGRSCSPYHRRDRSRSPYYRPRRSPSRSISWNSREDSPVDQYYRRSRYRSISPRYSQYYGRSRYRSISLSYSPRGRSYSRSYSPRPRRSRRSYSRSYSPRPRRSSRSCSRSYTPRPGWTSGRRYSRRSYSRSHSPQPRSYLHSCSPRPRSYSRHCSPKSLKGRGRSHGSYSSRSYSSRSAPSRSRSMSKSASPRSASPSS
ncbi:hypothetical protein Nepgr_014087 [Nepenthes gracilis]|uniref:RRM domain-containing protein n=1 Tax=Nepenthes gracilis TaxID=150966 RepID=A0AAD3SKC5_NEPGR|nr:hypothetical protein Nepgr_014087 [Nepenthes gracilis]